MKPFFATPSAAETRARSMGPEGGTLSVPGGWVAIGPSDPTRNNQRRICGPRKRAWWSDYYVRRLQADGSPEALTAARALMTLPPTAPAPAGRARPNLPESRRRELGSPIVVSIRLSQALLAGLDEACAERGASRSAAIAEACEAWVRSSPAGDTR